MDEKNHSSNARTWKSKIMVKIGNNLLPKCIKLKFYYFIKYHNLQKIKQTTITKLI